MKKALELMQRNAIGEGGKCDIVIFVCIEIEIYAGSNADEKAVAA